MDTILTISTFLIIFMMLFTGVSVFLDGRFFTLRKTVKILILLTCIFAILYETVLFRPQTATMNYKLELFWSYRLAFAGKAFYLKQIVLNILLYVPFGFMLPAVFPKMKLWQAILICLLFSACIETIQLVGRIGLFELDDMFNNMLGGVIGGLCYRGQRLLRPRQMT